MADQCGGQCVEQRAGGLGIITSKGTVELGDELKNTLVLFFERSDE